MSTARSADRLTVVEALVAELFAGLVSLDTVLTDAVLVKEPPPA